MKYDINTDEKNVIKRLVLDYRAQIVYNLNRVDLPRDKYYDFLRNEIVITEKLLKKL